MPAPHFLEMNRRKEIGNDLGIERPRPSLDINENWGKPATRRKGDPTSRVPAPQLLKRTSLGKTLTSSRKSSSSKGARTTGSKRKLLFRGHGGRIVFGKMDRSGSPAYRISNFLPLERFSGSFYFRAQSIFGKRGSSLRLDIKSALVDGARIEHLHETQNTEKK